MRHWHKDMTCAMGVRGGDLGEGAIKHPLGVIDETLCLSDLFGSVPGFEGGGGALASRDGL